MTSPSNWEEFRARLAIQDVLFRYCRAVDRGDGELLRSMYHPDAVDNHGPFTGNGDELAEWLASQPGRAQLVTQHHITNSIIQVDGNRAAAETYFIAYHWQPAAEDQPSVMHQFNGRYLDRFENRDGEWRIARRTVVHDQSVREITGKTWPGLSTFAHGTGNTADPSYAMLVP